MVGWVSLCSLFSFIITFLSPDFLLLFFWQKWQGGHRLINSALLHSALCQPLHRVRLGFFSPRPSVPPTPQARLCPVWLRVVVQSMVPGVPCGCCLCWVGGPYEVIGTASFTLGYFGCFWVCGMMLDPFSSSNIPGEFILSLILLCYFLFCFFHLLP